MALVIRALGYEHQKSILHCAELYRHEVGGRWGFIARATHTCVSSNPPSQELIIIYHSPRIFHPRAVKALKTLA